MNEEYSIDCTGNVCAGDEILFERAVFTGKYPKVKFDYMEIVKAKVLKESYGKDKQQHTFTCLDLDLNTEFRIKGRNIYRNGTKRKPWENEDDRLKVLEDKYSRGSKARSDRKERIESKFEKQNNYL